MHRVASLALAVSLCLFVGNLVAQQSTSAAVPNLIRYSGTLKEAQSADSSVPMGVTFAIYKQQDGGAPVWQETQNVTPDASGQYSVVLGSTTATGLPSDLFSQQEQRWLGVQVQGEAEQARVLLVSVPYAFKAHEAETLGGLPASAFAQVSPSQPGAGLPGSGSQKNESSASFNPLASPITGGGTKNYIAIWTSMTSLGNSVIYQSSGNVGIGTTSPTSKLTVAGTASGSAINSASNYQVSGTVVLSTLGTGNLFLGKQAGQLNTTGKQNTFSGYQAGHNNTAGVGNSYFGYQAGYNNTTSAYNSYFGYQAGFNVTGSFSPNNTFVGYQAGFGMQQGNDNTWVGYSAGLGNGSVRNTGIGSNAGAASGGAGDNTFVGADAGRMNQGYENTIIGAMAGRNNLGAWDTYLGYNAGINNTYGSSDIDIGNDGCPYPCMEQNTIRIGTQGTGPRQQNVAYIAGIYGNALSGASLVGVNAQGQLGTTTGLPPGSPYYIQNGTVQQPTSNFNISGNGTVGGALAANVVNSTTTYQIGGSNVLSTGIIPGLTGTNLYVGLLAGGAATNSFPNYLNVFSGFKAGYINGGHNNTFSGAYAGWENTDGKENSFYGSNAGFSNSSGSNNVFVGSGAGSYNKTGSLNVYIANEGPHSGTENYALRIGDPEIQNAAYVAGIYNSAATPTGTFQSVCVDINGTVFGTVAGSSCVISSRRFKDQILNMGDSSSKLFQLRPVTFLYKPQYDDGSHLLQYGLIAEEVAKVYPEMVVYDKDGEPYAVKYQLLAPMLLNELQKQHTVVAAQQDVIKIQQGQIQTQEQQIADVQERLKHLESLVEAKATLAQK